MKDREEQERRNIEAEKEALRAEYQRVLKNSVSFERRIRDRWRDKNRRKNEKIVALEARVKELERHLADS